MWLRTHLLKTRPLAAIVLGYIASENFEAVHREHRPFVSNCQADDYTRNNANRLSTRDSKPLSRNFIADAADVASPAVVNIGYVCSFLNCRFLTMICPSTEHLPILNICSISLQYFNCSKRDQYDLRQSFCLRIRIYLFKRWLHRD